MIKLISFIVLTHFFKILRQPGNSLFKVKPTIFFYSVKLFLKINEFLSVITLQE